MTYMLKRGIRYWDDLTSCSSDVGLSRDDFFSSSREGIENTKTLFSICRI